MNRKRTVITTEKREVWVIREGVPDPPADATIEVSNALEDPADDSGLRESGDFGSEEEG